jgi:hypothetical protein
MKEIPIELERMIIKKYLGDINSLRILKCVSKRFSYIKYHTSNHVKCKKSGWYVKNFTGNHICNVKDCMLTCGIRNNGNSLLSKKRKINL